MNSYFFAFSRQPAIREVGQCFRPPVRCYRKHCTPRTGHATLKAKGRQSIECRLNIRAQLSRDRLKVVVAEIGSVSQWPLVKSVQIDAFGLPVEVRRFEDGGCRYTGRRLDDPKRQFGQIKRADDLTNPFDPRIVTADKKRDISAKGRAELAKCVNRELATPQMVECQ